MPTCTRSHFAWPIGSPATSQPSVPIPAKRSAMIARTSPASLAPFFITHVVELAYPLVKRLPSAFRPSALRISTPFPLKTPLFSRFSRFLAVLGAPKGVLGVPAGLLVTPGDALANPGGALVITGALAGFTAGP